MQILDEGLYKANDLYWGCLELNGNSGDYVQ